MRQVILVEGALGKVAFETDPDNILLDVSTGGIIRQALGNLADEANATILNCYASFSKAAVSIMSDASKEFESVEASFGIKLGAEGNLFVAKGTTEANLVVKFSWKR